MVMTPVVTATGVHLFSSHEVIVTMVVPTSVLVSIESFELCLVSSVVAVVNGQ